MFKKFLITATILLASGHASATVWMIGDDDGYGIGIPDNANHTFVSPVDDYRSAAEKAATNGAQYTDTYSTCQGAASPSSQTCLNGDTVVFTFSGLGSGWTTGSMWFDMADFQATTFGAVITTYNGINQNWAFNDGYPSTVVRYFDLSPAVIASINLLGSLTVEIDRNGSGDYYGFDYALLSDNVGAAGVPAPAALLLFGLGLLSLGLRKRA